MESSTTSEDSLLHLLDAERAVAVLCDGPDGARQLLHSISIADPWRPEYDEVLVAVYRTRLRHMFSPRQRSIVLKQFADHLNIARTLVSSHSSYLASRLELFELIVKDALQEGKEDWLGRALEKKHVKKMLEVLLKSPGLTSTGSEVISHLDLKPANLSRILSLAESVGLIERSYEGKELRISLTPLGCGRAEKSQNPLTNIICGFGIDSKSIYAYSEAKTPYENTVVFKACRSSGRITLRNEEGNQLDSTEYEIKFVKLCPIYMKSEYRLVAYTTSVNQEHEIELGRWRDLPSIPDIATWVRQLNDCISRATNSVIAQQRNKSMRSRVIDRRTLYWLPGKSMSAVEIQTMRDYAKEWMNRTVDNIVKELHDPADANSIFRDRGPNIISLNSIKTERRQWPPSGWSAVFDLMHSESSFDMQDEKIKRRSLDLCFEFLYLDKNRVGAYDIIRIGDIDRFAFVFSPEIVNCDYFLEAFNWTYQKAREFNDKLNKSKSWEVDETIYPIVEFSEFIHSLREFGAVDSSRSGSRWTVVSESGTISNNIVRQLVDFEGFYERYERTESKTEGCLDYLVGATHHSCIFADLVVANDLLSRAKLHGHEIFAIPVRYPEKIPYGIGVPKSDLEWKELMSRALFNSIRVGQNQFADDWIETARDLQRICASLDSDYNPFATNQSKTAEAS